MKKRVDFPVIPTVFSSLLMYLTLNHIVKPCISTISVGVPTSTRGHMFTGKFPGLTSAFPSRRRGVKSAVSSSSRTQDLMLPPSLRSRKRPAGHLAPRIAIPRLHRASSRCRVLAACAKYALLYIPNVSLPISAACPNVCSL